MSMAPRLKQYLDQAGVTYELIHHPYSSTTMEAARKAQIPVQQTAKAVVLEDGDGYLLAVVPASRQIGLDKVRDRCGRPVQLAREQDFADLFGDCDLGAVPPIGAAYDVPTVWDDTLIQCSDIFFEAGDHADLVHISGSDFQQLMNGAEHGSIAQAA